MTWGWLLVVLGGRGQAERSWRNLLAIILATFAFGLQILGFTDLRTLIIFLASTVLSLTLHLAWLHSLRHRSTKRDR